VIDLRTHLGVPLIQPPAPPPQAPAEEPEPEQDEIPFSAEDLREIYVTTCRDSFADFVREAWRALHPSDALEWSHHHDTLCDHVQWLLEGWMCKQADPSYQQPARQMIVNLPPSTLKTELLMVFAPAWMWLRSPSWRVLCLSCNPRVSLQSAVDSRRVIESPWYQELFAPGWQLRDDQNAKSNFGTTAGGSRQSHGMSATVVGEHADAIFIDDPTDPKEVTRAELERVNSDWPSIRNRVTDERSAVRVIIQQRLDVEDLSGFILGGKTAAQWLHVVLPLEFDPKRACATPMPVGQGNRLALEGGVGTWIDPRRERGEVLQPSRFPPDVLTELRDNAGPYAWSSQYQQDPTPREGGRIKREWLGFCRLADHHAGDHRRPEGCGLDHRGQPRPTLIVPRKNRGWALDWLWLSVDPASKKTERGSLWGMLAVGGMGARRLVLDDRSKRGEPVEILEIVRDMVRTWRPARLLIEDTAAGPTLINMLKDELSAGKIPDDEGRAVVCTIQPLTPHEVGGDKEARLDGVINQFSADLIYMLDGASWVADFVDELSLFPNGPTKDRVDALTQLLAIARGSSAPKWMELFKDKPIHAAQPKAIDVATGKPPTECFHSWVEGKCRVCGKPAG
jgi:phage terminase large subunit-like protein